ncbi:thioredoxin-disulfide reductase [bacterium]|nr:thioredoxin-disulfide reductase [bacterium]
MSKIYDVLIVGSGPAGYTAAIYTARADLKTAIIAGHESGGQLMLTSEVENFPGFSEGIMGPDLMSEMKKQALRFGTEFIHDQIEHVDLKGKVKQLKSAKHNYEAKTVIIATGSQAQWLNLPSEQRLMGRGISACATCDGYFFKDKEIVVVGGGDSAMEEALTLTKFGSHVTIVHRRDAFRASKIMQKRVLEHDKISVIWNAVVDEVLGESFVEGVKIRDVESDKTSEVPCQGLFIAIGHKPSTSFLGGQLELDDKAYVKAKDQVKTNLDGVFVAGDVADPHYRQAITAAGDGCRAALEAERYLIRLGE